MLEKRVNLYSRYMMSAILHMILLCYLIMFAFGD